MSSRNPFRASSRNFARRRNVDRPQQPRLSSDPLRQVQKPRRRPSSNRLLLLTRKTFCDSPKSSDRCAFLRPMCAAVDGPEWSRRMQVLLESEGTTPGRKERLAGAYNKGYQAFALTYRVCTPSAQEASSRYVKEGELLARTIAGRYGG